MADPSGKQRGGKRARTEDDEGGASEKEDVDVKLGDGLRKMMGRIFVKESELSRALLLRFLKDQGNITLPTMHRIMADPSGKQRGGKRARTEDDEGGASEKEDVDVKLGDGLRKMMGRIFVKESGLSRALLLRFLKDRGEVREVELIKVKCTMMGGHSFELPLEAKSKVIALKQAIEEGEGISRFDQQMFLVSKEGRKITKPGEVPMENAEVLDVSCSLALCVDDSHRFIRTGDHSTISGEAGCIVTHHSDDKGGADMSLTNIVVDAASGPVYAEFKKADRDVNGAIDEEELYSLMFRNGSLMGHGKNFSDAQGTMLRGFGCIKVGDRVGVLVKVGERGFVRYFLNDKEFGPGYRPGEEIKDRHGNPTGEILGPIKSPLEIVVGICPGEAVELLPNAKIPVGI